jgi:leader peptidase (prepilin peptidase)/N-methyltransferase
MTLFFDLHPIGWTVLFSLFGLIIGSFLNVVIFRLPIILERQWGIANETAATQAHEQFNLAWPSSLCSHCGSPLQWWQNIPLISFLLQKGRCATCQQAISWQYPLVEFTTALVAGFLAYYFGFSATTFLLFAFFAMALVLSVIDIQKGLLPDNVTYLLLWSGLFISIFDIFIPAPEAILSAIIGYVSLWSIYWAFKIVTGKDSMGHGDFKLTAAIGAWVGWQALTLVILFSALFGLIYALWQIKRGNAERDTEFAFGPYLALVGFVVLVFKDEVMRLFY